MQPSIGGVIRRHYPTQTNPEIGGTLRYSSSFVGLLGQITMHSNGERLLSQGGERVSPWVSNKFLQGFVLRKSVFPQHQSLLQCCVLLWRQVPGLPRTLTGAGTSEFSNGSGYMRNGTWTRARNSSLSLNLGWPPSLKPAALAMVKPFVR